MISIKSAEAIRIMAEGGKILAQIMKKLEKMIGPGITTKELDKAAEALVFKFGAHPSFKNYQGFPATLCVSINEEIVHIAPSNRQIKKGDIVSIDLGIFYLGFHTDMAITVPVGEINPETARMIKIAKKALKRGIKKVKPGNTFGDIGNTIQRCVESQGFAVVRDLCGHGIGREIHEEPKILNYGKRRTGPEIVKGMVFCIEPMITMGDWRIKKSADGYGFETADGSLSAHFEQTVAVTKDGVTVLTMLE